VRAGRESFSLNQVERCSARLRRATSLCFGKPDEITHAFFFW
jgi:hypothetical protein